MLYSCNFGVFSSYFRRKFGGFIIALENPKSTFAPQQAPQTMRDLVAILSCSLKPMSYASGTDCTVQKRSSKRPTTCSYSFSIVPQRFQKKISTATLQAGNTTQHI
uniref:Uncharacterized protein n=1 Tax=Haemonchus contortus TaxID=6289 RepID=W6NCG0_HAECO